MSLYIPTAIMVNLRGRKEGGKRGEEEDRSVKNLYYIRKLMQKKVCGIHCIKGCID